MSKPISKDKEIIKLSSKSVLSFVAHSTDAVKIHIVISSMKNKNSFDHDGVSINMLKYIAALYSVYIAHCFNDSILKSEFPQCFKIDEIFRIHKKDNMSHPSNYRPINILPALSKVFEKLMEKCIIKFRT